MRDETDNAESQRRDAGTDAATSEGDRLPVRIIYMTPEGEIIGSQEDVQRLLDERNNRICNARGITREHLERERAFGPACACGDASRVRELLDLGVNPDWSGDMGETLVMVAARRGHAEVVRMLVESGVRVDAVDYLGWTAADYAESGGHTDVAEYLRSIR
jgi:ankyrin repeat protein